MPLRGVVLYLGPSTIDGAEIACIATLKTTNAKTGDMVQTWILRTDQSPLSAINTGDDSSVCGACPLRGLVDAGRNRGRACYVSVRNAPSRVWDAWKAGRYPDYDPTLHRELFRGRMLRMGSYGDPVAIPLRTWSPLLRLVRGWTGYTHQWDSCNQRWRRYVMANIESSVGADAARAMGWRSFRVRTTEGEIRADEIVCPAAPEGGNRRTCETCGACNGGDVRKRSVVIVGHGGPPVFSQLGRYVS